MQIQISAFTQQLKRALGENAFITLFNRRDPIMPPPAVINGVIIIIYEVLLWALRLSKMKVSAISLASGSVVGKTHW